MKTIIIIPARYASSRYPGKSLVDLNLPNGEKKSLIELTWRTAVKVKNIHDIFIATDDTRIATAARAFGAKVIMTSSHCRNGTERCAEAVDNAKLDADLIINFQGDAPLTPPWFVESLVQAMDKDDKSSMATPVVRLDRLTYGHFLEDRKKTLVDIKRNNETQHIPCFLADWGYLKNTDRNNLPYGIKLLKLENLEQLLAI